MQPTPASMSGDPESSPGHVRTRHGQSVADVSTAADRELAAMGYSPFVVHHFALSISGLFATVATTFSFPLQAGGAASVVWCWLVAGWGALCLALSIAEIASAYPTSGALYFTVKFLAPPAWVPAIAWVDGWLNLIGQVCGSAASVYSAAQMLLAVVSIASDGGYLPTSGHTVGLMAALSVAHGLVNTLSTSWLSHLTKSYAVVHIAVLLAACVALLAVQKDKHDTAYVFTHVESSSGWSPPGFSFLFGFLSVAWTMTDYDATAHIAEEAKDPARTVPRAIAAALTFTYVVGWLYNIVLVYCMGDPAALFDSPAGQPVVQIFRDVLGKGPAVFFGLAAFVVMNFVCVTAMQAGSRTIWAFSRDRMLPGSRVWHRIWPLTGTPVLAVWLYTLLCVLIDLIGLGSYVTISAIFNTCTIALDWSYCIPIFCRLAFGRFERGPWHLGPASVYINAWACVWTAFVSVIFLFPTVMPATPEKVNYAAVILAFVCLVSTAYWFWKGRKYYTGPRTEARVAGDGIARQELPPEKSAENPRSHIAATEDVQGTGHAHLTRRTMNDG